MRTAWSLSCLNLQRDTRVAVAPTGELVGYAEVQDLEDRHKRFGLLLAGSALGQLADWAEARVAAASVPPSRIVCYALSSDVTLKSVLESRDFEFVRHFFRMGIDLGPGTFLPRPHWPEGVTVRNLAEGDERFVYELHQETFEGLEEHVRMSYNDWAHSLLGGENFDSDLWWVAETEAGLAGFIACERDDRDVRIGWGLLLGVRIPWRGSGLGLSLVHHAMIVMRSLGMRRMLGGVDGDNRARRLYERAGMGVDHQFDIYEKAVVPRLLDSPSACTGRPPSRPPKYTSESEGGDR